MRFHVFSSLLIFFFASSVYAAAPVISIDNTSLPYTEGDAATQIDLAATLTDSDGDADWNAGTLVVQITANAEAADEVSIPDNVVGTINSSGTDLYDSGTIIGTLNASEGTVTNGTALIITFNASATNVLVQQVLQAVHYRNTSSAPGTSNRTVTITATDATAASANDTRTIAISDIPAPISSVTLPSNNTYVEGENIDFTVNFDESITVNTSGGTPRLSLTLGVTAQFASYISGTGSTALLFRYTVQSGDLDGDGISLNATLDPNSGTLQDAAGNTASNNLGTFGSLAAVLVDAQVPVVAEVTAVVTPSNDTTPSVTFSSTEAGTLAVGGSCGSGDEGAISSGNTTITLTQTDNTTPLTGATYSDCTITVTDSASNGSNVLTLTSFQIDVAGPTVAEVTAVVTPSNDTTPSVTFSSTEAGTLAVGGSCGSSDEGAISSGNTTITLTQTDNSTPLAGASYSDCTVTVTDAVGNASNVLTLSSFQIDLVGPTVAEVTAVVTPNNDTTPSVTFSSTETGTLAVGGSCGSGDEGAISSGNTTITLTQTDNATPLAGATYSDCTITVTDSAGNGSNVLTLSSFQIDVAGPTVAEVTAVVTPNNDTTPSVTFSSTEAGTLAVGGSCGSGDEGAVSSGNTTITLTKTNNTTPLTGATYSDCTVTVTDVVGNSSNVLTLSSFQIDVAGPTVAEVAAVVTPNNDTTPSVTFSSTEAGTLAVGGSCGSSDEGATSSGNTTITLTQADNSTPLAGATYSDCTITVTDSASNGSNVLTLTSFQIDLVGPTVAEVTAVVTPNNDTTPNVTFSSTEAGTLTVGGSCGSASEGVISSGNTTITLTQTNNLSALADSSYNDCTITVTDSAGNGSNVLTLSSFVVDLTPPSVDVNATKILNEGDTGVIVSDTLLSSSDSSSSATSITYTVKTKTGNGILRLNGSALSKNDAFTQASISSNLLTYDHDGSETTSDSFTFSVADQFGNSNNNGGSDFIYNFSVGVVNDPPSTTADTASTDEDNAVTIDVLANDSDPDDGINVASVAISVSASHGATSIDVGTGEVTYTPDANYNGSDNFSYTVKDANMAISSAAQVTITVNSVNDAPVAVADSVPTLDNTLVTINVAANDTDVDAGDAPDSSTIAVASTPTNGSAVINAGKIDYTPGSGFTGTDTFTYTIKDNAGDTSNAATVTITVTAGVDSDGDTISDAQEIIDGTDPNDPGDYLDELAPVLTIPADIIVDAVGLFTSVTQAQLFMVDDSTTQAQIQSMMEGVAVDNVDGASCCNTSILTLSDGRLLLPPGRNLVTWRAVDRKGNVSKETQFVNVRPLVSLSKDQITVEGSLANIRIILNGKAPFYPFLVPYVIDSDSTADNSDHDLVDGFVTFNSGETETSIAVNIVVDSATEGDEVLTIVLDDNTSESQDLTNGFSADIYDINSGINVKHNLTIVEGNVAPVVSLQVEQNGENAYQITNGGGAVTVTATVTDLNIGDSGTFDWSASDNVLVDSDGNSGDLTMIFDPSNLSVGLYTAVLTATDSQGATDTATIHMVLVDELPVLSASEDTDNDGIDDVTEGTTDTDEDGIPDYLDNIAALNVLPGSAAVTNAYLVECDPGVSCRLGQFSALGLSGGASLSQGDIERQDDLVIDESYDLHGTIFDFEMHELATAGQQVKVVLPLSVAIPENGVYRKFQNGAWVTFVDDDRNDIHSSQGLEGYCPPPGDASWQPGMTAGHFCLQLTLEDGGPNDADSEVNSAISDPGAVGVLIPVQAAPSVQTAPAVASVTTSSIHSSGGGSIGWAMLVMLLLFGSFKVYAVDWADMTKKSFIEVEAFSAKGFHDSSDFSNDMSNAGVDVDVTGYDVLRTAYQVSLGYTYNPYATFLISYTDLGDVRVDFDTSTTDDELLGQALSKSYPVTGDGVSIAYRYRYSFMRRWSVFADAGVFFWNNDVDLGSASGSPDIDGGTDPMFALGIDYSILRRTTLGLKYRYHQLDEQSLMGLGFLIRVNF